MVWHCRAGAARPGDLSWPAAGAVPGRFVQATQFLGLDYYQGLTLHGVINALVFTTFFEVAFGYVVLAYFLRCGFHPAVSWAAFALMLSGTLMAAAAILSGRASVLYTFYPPLRASPLFYLGAALLVVGSWVPYFQWIQAYRDWRRAHPERTTPLGVVGMLATFTIWFFATLPLAYEVLVQLLPWSLGWTPTVNVVLARTLFWFFGHPLVYFWLLPAYVMFYVMLPALAGGKLYSDTAGRAVFLLFIVLSAPVGIHHQFADPAISSGYKWLHGVLTFFVAVPSFMTAFTLAASLEYAGRAHGGTGLFGWWRRLPYFDRERYLFAYFFAGLVLFFFGGITGIIQLVGSHEQRGAQHRVDPGTFPHDGGRSGLSELHWHDAFLGDAADRQTLALAEAQPMGAVPVVWRDAGLFRGVLRCRLVGAAAANQLGVDVFQSGLGVVPSDVGVVVAARRDRWGDHLVRHALLLRGVLYHPVRPQGARPGDRPADLGGVSRRGCWCVAQLHAVGRCGADTAGNCIRAAAVRGGARPDTGGPRL